MLHRLVTVDFVYIVWNKFVVACFTSHYLQWLLYGNGQHIVLSFEWEAFTWTNMLLPLPLSFLVYDLMYAPFHRFLHWTPVYPYVIGDAVTGVLC